MPGAECQDSPERAVNVDLSAFMPLVRSIARRIHASIPPYAAVDLDDLLQSGHLGLVNAGRAYESNRKVPFAVYARFRIRGEILDSLRQSDIASRRLRQLEKQKRYAKFKLIVDLLREPTSSELDETLINDAPKAGCRPVKLDILNLPSITFCSLEILDSGRESWRALDRGAHLRRSAAEARRLLDSMIERLPTRSQELLCLYYQRGLTMGQIGERFQVNESRVSQIHRDALDSLARHLRASGVNSLSEVADF